MKNQHRKCENVNKETQPVMVTKCFCGVVFLLKQATTTTTKKKRWKQTLAGNEAMKQAGLASVGITDNDELEQIIKAISHVRTCVSSQNQVFRSQSITQQRPPTQFTVWITGQKTQKELFFEFRICWILVLHNTHIMSFDLWQSASLVREQRGCYSKLIVVVLKVPSFRHQSCGT